MELDKRSSNQSCEHLMGTVAYHKPWWLLMLGMEVVLRSVWGWYKRLASGGDLHG